MCFVLSVGTITHYTLTGRSVTVVKMIHYNFIIMLIFAQIHTTKMCLCVSVTVQSVLPVLKLSYISLQIRQLCQK